ncbi:importin subunit alpha-4 isoform X1 [Macrosteles quadrilineatus]|uniref:importin subunit alpha-4 isoform X1 n=1 Tax=Macrosteles quadrilineatus TaxID=74068 RepID=UPI0023E32EDD|nr:importin subunit alpha-4 isoform X1 [Macrosteles quadrilineatus]
MDSADKLRDHARLAVVESRLTSRENILKNKRKSLQDVVDNGRLIKNEEVTILANKLKTKSLVQFEDLALLKIAFVQSSHNIVAFLKVKGALHGLVREFSSAKPNFELLAAECICNLALGDAKSCFIVAKAAGPYLLTTLSGFNDNLKAISVWALGNLVGSDEKTWKIVHSQGLMGKLLQLVSENDNLPDMREDLIHNSLTTLTQFLRVGAQHLTAEEIQDTTNTIVRLKNSTSEELVKSIYLLSCMEASEPQLINHKLHLKCLNFLVDEDITVETVLKFTACVRIIANLAAENSGVCALEIITHWKSVQRIIQKISLATYTHLRIELGWLLGNIVNHSSAQVQNEIAKFSNDILQYDSKCLFLPLNSVVSCD